MKPKSKSFGLFRCFKPISKQPKQTELFRNKPKQTETTLNFRKNIQIYSCPASPEKRRPSAARLLPAPTQMALCPRLCLLRLLRRELLRAFATLDDPTPQRRISELRVWSYEPFIVFAPSSSGYTSGQNLEVLYILNNRNNQNILRNYALHIRKLKQ